MCLMSSNPKLLVTLESGKKFPLQRHIKTNECCHQVASKTANVNLLLSAQLVFFLFSHKQKNVQQ
jgi:hypothetical protein